MAEVCEDSTPILDAFFDDLIVGVITNSVGCEPPYNPILCKHTFSKHNLYNLYK